MISRRFEEKLNRKNMKNIFAPILLRYSLKPSLDQYAIGNYKENVSLISACKTEGLVNGMTNRQQENRQLLYRNYLPIISPYKLSLILNF